MRPTLKAFLVVSAVLALAVGALIVYRSHGSQPEVADAQAYADPATCLRCHAEEADGYARTGMAHAFYKPTAEDTIQTPGGGHAFLHTASQSYYELTAHDGRFFEHRWQKGFDGAPDNSEELSIDYVMGSGNHVRTYLHREADSTLIELPLAWYSEDGGHLGMNPGFDNAHPMTRRPIAYECMFCHNAYPQIPATAHRDLSANPVYTSLPEGIDCQRCHGPGASHVATAERPGAALKEVRASILNPSHLDNSRQMQVCEQCHLETTSHLLPDRIRHYDQEPFGYSPASPLAGFNAYFSRDPSVGRIDNFEIVSSPYRLKQSRCYLESQGALTCEKCHNPHDLHKGPASATYYANICLSCHAASLEKLVAARQHIASNDCVSCHMPKRRTEDVVHAVMTDHLIQRRPLPATQLLAAKQEMADTPANAYRGTVKRYLLDGEVTTAGDALYDALAQVIDGSNSEQGIPALERILAAHHPSQPNPYIELGDAKRHAGNLDGAIEAYRQAVSRDPLSERAQRRLGAALGASGHTAEALAVLHKAIEVSPTNALLWYEMALIELRAGPANQAIADLRETLRLKPDLIAAQNTLGSALAQSGDQHNAEAAFRAALSVDPADAATRANLGRLLAAQGDWKQSAFQLQQAVRLAPEDAAAHTDFAVVLVQMHRLPEATAQARAAILADPRSKRAKDVLEELTHP